MFLSAVSSVVNAKPDSSGLPGADVLSNLTNGLEYWALAIALLGLIIGAACWAVGSHSQNFHQSVTGRRAVLVSGLAALIIGASPALINWFFSAGSGIH